MRKATIYFSNSRARELRRYSVTFKHTTELNTSSTFWSLTVNFFFNRLPKKRKVLRSSACILSSFFMFTDYKEAVKVSFYRYLIRYFRNYLYLYYYTNYIFGASRCKANQMYFDMYKNYNWSSYFVIFIYKIFISHLLIKHCLPTVACSVAAWRGGKISSHS